MKTPRIAFLLISTFAQVHASDSFVIGLITSPDERPIPYVNVYVPDQNQGTTTDKQGKFILKLTEDRIVLFLSHSAFEAKEVPVERGSGEILHFVLKPKTYYFEPVVVEGNLYARESLRLPATHSVLHINSSPNWGVSVAEKLDSKGIQIKDYGGPAGLKTVASATGYGEHILVMLETIPLNSPQNGIVDFSFLPADWFSQGEFYMGHGSSLYGSNAIGGTLNLSVDRHGPSFLQLKTGSFGERGISGKVRRKLGSGRLALYGTTYKNVGDFRKNNDFDQKALGSRFSIPLGKLWNASAFSMTSFIDRGISGSVSYPSPLARKENGDNIFLASVHGLSRMGQSEVSLGLTRSLENFADSSVPIESRHSVGSLRVRAIQRFPEVSVIRNSITLDVSEDEVDSDDAGHHARVKAAVGYLGELRWDPSLHLYTSIRVDWDQGKTRPVTTGSLASVWTPNSALVNSLSINAGTSYRYPTFNELFWEDAWGNTGNASLEPELGWSAEFAAELQPTSFDLINVRLRGYHFFTENMIQWVPDDRWTYSPVNITASESYGVSVTVRIRPVKLPLRIDFGSDVNQSRVLSEGSDHLKRLLYVPSVAHWGESSFGIRFLTVRLNYRYFGRRRWTYDGDFTPDPYVDPYLRVDASLSLPGPSFVNSETSIEVGVRNLENRTGQQSVHDYPEPGRALFARLSVEFR